MKNKKARFAPFWILFGLLGVLLLGVMITPFKITLDDTFDRMDNNAIANGDTTLSCSDPNAKWYIKSTCFTLGGFMSIFIIYVLYSWVSAMYNGSKSKTAIFSPRYKAMQRALEQ